MRRLLITLLVLFVLCGTVSAAEEPSISTEDLTEGLSDEAMELLPENMEQDTDFWSSLENILASTFKKSFGSFYDGLRLCGILLCILTLCSAIDLSANKSMASILNLVGALGICAAIMGSMRSMITMASDIAEDMSSFGSILLPAMASVTAMSGGISSASALYAGTVIFSQLLLQLIGRLLIPMVYFYLAIATAEAAMGSQMLSELREFIGWLISKSLRIILYIFLAYMTITGVISGTADAAAVKATKAAVSGMIPVVGSILSDASESLLSGAAIMKNSVGIFGMLGVFASCLLPILKVGMQYLLMKITAAIGGSVGLASQVKLLKEFSKAMGYLLAMCACSALLLLIGIICMMRVS